MVTTTAFAAEATAKSDTAHGPSLGTADPTRRRSLRSARNLLIWCAALVVGSILVVVLGPKPQRDVYLDPEGRGQQGVGALVEVLRAQGIEVSTAKSIDDLRAAREVAGSGPVTVAVGPTTFLTPEGARSALTTIEPDDRLVLLDLHLLDRSLQSLERAIDDRPADVVHAARAVLDLLVDPA